MFDNDWHDDPYHGYEEAFDPMRLDRQARRKRKPKIKHQPKKPDRQILREIADAEGLEAGFQTTYTPGLFEQGWLRDALRTFYDQVLITDVLARVRGGKEANVYCCAAHPSTGQTLLAAKVYRPRMFRNLRNDQMYREGREVLTDEGHPIKKTDHRLMRALGKKTSFGQEVAHTSWIQHEVRALKMLHGAGAAVPMPFASSSNAILMTYVGEADAPAPALSDVALEAGEAPVLFDEALRNLELMLQQGLVHGDLSAYNMLYWDGRITLIDFPQVIDVRGSRLAADLLRRDVERVCEYFASQGHEQDPQAIFHRLWQRHKPVSGRDADADASRWQVED